GVNYQWQKAINDTDDWQDILNADSKILTTTIDTVAGNIVYYRLKVVCTDTQTTYYSNEINLPIYCVTTTTSFYESITAINVSDINYATTTNAKYYFPSASIAGNLTAGETYAFTATGNNNYAQDQIKVWIDFNSNGSFEDAGELVLTTSGLIPWNGNITIPGDVESGVTRMRVRLSYGAISTSCQNNDYGQTIDLMVNVHAVEGCTGISENIVAQTLDANSSTIGLKAEGVAGTTQTISYQWQQSFEESNEWLDIENANSLHSTVAIVGSIGQTINYRLKVTCLISDEEHFSNVVPYEIIPYYCAAGATSTQYHKINNVTFAGINNNSTSTAGYED